MHDSFPTANTSIIDFEATCRPLCRARGVRPPYLRGRKRAALRAAPEPHNPRPRHDARCIAEHRELMYKRIDLNGTWKLRWSDGQRGDRLPRAIGPKAGVLPALEAQVPGEVHLDLMRAGLIGDPSLGLNALAARWVEEAVWYYRRTFDAPALAPGERACL